MIENCVFSVTPGTLLLAFAALETGLKINGI